APQFTVRFPSTLPLRFVVPSSCSYNLVDAGVLPTAANGKGDMPMNQSAFGQADDAALFRRSHFAGFRSAERPAAHDDATAHAIAAPRPGTATIPNINIVNAKGVPGTLGCIARTRSDGRLVLLSSWHVPFGGGARESDPVWLLDERDGARRYERAADAWY